MWGVENALGCGLVWSFSPSRRLGRNWEKGKGVLNCEPHTSYQATYVIINSLQLQPPVSFRDLGLAFMTPPKNINRLFLGGGIN